VDRTIPGTNEEAKGNLCQADRRQGRLHARLTSMFRASTQTASGSPASKIFIAYELRHYNKVSPCFGVCESKNHRIVVSECVGLW